MAEDEVLHAGARFFRNQRELWFGRPAVFVDMEWPRLQLQRNRSIVENQFIELDPENEVRGGTMMRLEPHDAAPHIGVARG